MLEGFEPPDIKYALFDDLIDGLNTSSLGLVSRKIMWFGDKYTV
jgi:hypothetical protein